MIQIQQDTQEWHDIRAQKIGSSDAPIIMGVSPYKTPYQLYEIKTQGVVEKPNSNMLYGKEMELLSRERYEEENFCTLEPVVMFHSKYDWMMASFDGWNSDLKVCVEFKNCNKEIHEAAREGKVHHIYYPQVQHLLEVLFDNEGVDVLTFNNIHEGESLNVRVSLDRSYVIEMIEKEHEFYETCLVKRQPPPLMERDYKSMQNHLQWMAHAKRLKEIDSRLNELKPLEKERDELKKQLSIFSDGYSAAGGGVKIRKIIQPGRVNYKEIPVLQGIDLDQYRGNPFIQFRLDIEKD